MTAKMRKTFPEFGSSKPIVRKRQSTNGLKKLTSGTWKNIEQIKLRGRLFPFMNFIGKIGIVLILWRGGLLVIEGNNFNLGELVQFAIYYQMLISPSSPWLDHQRDSSRHGILASNPRNPRNSAGVFVPQNGNPEPQLQGEIEVRNLTFSYEPERLPVLKHISFHVKKGQTLAIVGPTGCGKSTIVNLLLHLYQIPPGHIFYDGLDINEIPVHVLRESIAYVSQSLSFSTTIKNNILFGMKNGRTEISENDILEAAEQAQLARDPGILP